MDTAEDSYLLLALARKAEPAFSFTLTSLHHQSEDDGSNFDKHPRRAEDLGKLARRLFARPLAAGEDLIERFRLDQEQAHSRMRLTQRGVARRLLEIVSVFFHSLATDGWAATWAKGSAVLRRMLRELTGRDPR